MPCRCCNVGPLVREDTSSYFVMKKRIYKAREREQIMLQLRQLEVD